MGRGSGRYTPRMHARETRVPPSGTSQPPAWHRWFLVAVLGVFGFGIVVNGVLEVGYIPAVRAVMVHDSGELSVAIAQDDTRYRARYWIASVVHDIGFGGRLVVPDEELIDAYRFSYVADSTVEVESYDPTLPDDALARLEGFPSVSGVGNMIGIDGFRPFVIVWSDEGAGVDTLRYWESGDTMYLVDDRLLGEGDTS